MNGVIDVYVIPNRCTPSSDILHLVYTDQYFQCLQPNTFTMVGAFPPFPPKETGFHTTLGMDCLAVIVLFTAALIFLQRTIDKL